MKGVRLPAGHRLIHFEDIDSTNAEARRLVASGERGPLWIWSDRQSLGRGRLGRNWVSEIGNLYVTFLFTTLAPTAALAQLSQVAALAVHDAALPFAGTRSILIKWPNDLLIDGAKFCGILCEGIGNDCASIGIGVNLTHAPPDTPYPAAALGNLLPGAFLERLAACVSARLEQWNHSAGFSSIREAWLERALGVGEEAWLGDERGIFTGIAPDGALILRIGDKGERNIHAGDIRFATLKRVREELK